MDLGFLIGISRMHALVAYQKYQQTLLGVHIHVLGCMKGMVIIAAAFSSRRDGGVSQT